jgi:hypothetical protein
VFAVGVAIRTAGRSHTSSVLLFLEPVDGGKTGWIKSQKR